MSQSLLKIIAYKYEFRPASSQVRGHAWLYLENQTKARIVITAENFLIISTILSSSNPVFNKETQWIAGMNRTMGAPTPTDFNDFNEVEEGT